MTTLRLVDYGSDAHDAPFAAHHPAVLVAYPEQDKFVGTPRWSTSRDWALDSGAFVAFSRGVTIDRAAYHDVARELLARDPRLVEVFALDVIGDWRASLANAEAAWSDGIPAIPTFHVGEPTHVLRTMAAQFPKIALGGAVRYHAKVAWARQCFATVWPKALHGLGFGSPDSIMALPFHSVDSSTWFTAPRRYGNWPHMTRGVQSAASRLRVYNVAPEMMSEVVRFYVDLERRAKTRWAKEMTMLDDELAAAGWRGVAA